MNKQDAAKFIMKIKARYPNAYAKFDSELMLAVVETWTEDLAAVPFEVADAALRQFVMNDTQGFPPTSGQLMYYIDKATHPEDKNGEEAWLMVKRAARCNPDSAAEQFKMLPEIIQRTIGSPGFLVDLGYAQETEDAVRKSLFIRTFDQTMKREREDRMMPTEVLKRLQSFGDKWKQLGGDDPMALPVGE